MGLFLLRPLSLAPSLLAKSSRVFPLVLCDPDMSPYAQISFFYKVTNQIGSGLTLKA
jgi:hypothetical protein